MTTLTSMPNTYSSGLWVLGSARSVSLQGFCLRALAQQVGQKANHQQGDERQGDGPPVRLYELHGPIAIPDGQQSLAEVTDAASNGNCEDEALNADSGHARQQHEHLERRR